MSLLTIPNVLVNGTGPANIVDAVGLNANFNAIATAVNNIYPSQVIPLNTTQATFGGAVGYTFGPPAVGQIALTVNGVAGSNAFAVGTNFTVGTNGNVFTTGVASITTNGPYSSPTTLPNGTIVGQTGANSGLLILGGATAAMELSMTTAGLGLTALGTAASQFAVTMNASQSTPGLLINGAASITGNLLEVDLTSGGTKAVVVNSGGALSFPSALGGALPNSASITASGGAGLIFNTASGGNPFFFASGSGGITSLANINGTSGAYTATSDARLKENVVDLSLGLAEVLQLRPVSYDWISSKEPGQGFIAQEVQKIVPHAVAPVNEDGSILGIIDALLTPVVVKSIQQLSAKLEAYIAAHP